VIIRPTESSHLLITQPDHAALAARIMQQWRADGLAHAPRRRAILLAVEEHDNGWREVDAVPMVDEASGRVLDFVNAPDEVRRAIWPRGVERLAATPYAAALVAQHAVHIYRRYRDDPHWASFFATMEAARDRHLHAASVAIEDLLHEYFFLRIADLASLTFCNAWTDTQTDDSGYTVHLDGVRLVVTPDPFDGGEIELEITGRELPAGPFLSAADVQRAWSAARPVVLTGVAVGG
jgi:hypothetical protein